MPPLRPLAAALAAALLAAGCSMDAGGLDASGIRSGFAELGAGFSGSRVAAKYRRQVVADPTGEEPGTIVIDTSDKFLYLVQEDGKAMRYGIGVGREGFGWKGRATIRRKAEWPGWTPPGAMRERQPALPAFMPGGPNNPLGARALYLYQGGRDTLYRIHGSNEPWSIGQNVSSGCIRLTNTDVMDLYERVPTGTKVVVQ